MQFVNAVSFALAGGALILLWRPSALSLLAAFAFACCLSGALALWRLRDAWRSLPPAAVPLGQRQLWSKLAPFAASVWITNWLMNVFALADRYILVHYANLSADVSLQLVGNYAHWCCPSR